LEVKGFDKVGWSGRSEAVVNGARRSGQKLSVKAGNAIEDSILTFNSDVCVWVELGRRSYRSLGSFIVIVAVNIVAIFVDEWGISTYNLSMKTCVLNFLYATSARAL
jgi:hypothetical protein